MVSLFKQFLIFHRDDPPSDDDFESGFNSKRSPMVVLSDSNDDELPEPYFLNLDKVCQNIQHACNTYK